MLRDAADAGERRIQRRKAKAKGHAAKAKLDTMARKYLIETYGCQMNVHDSERMAGLLEQAGYEPTADDARRRRDRHQHLQRARARRGEAVHAARRDPAAGARSTGTRPVVAVAGCVAQQEGAQILARSSRGRRHRRHAEHLKRLPMLVAAGVDRRRRTDSPRRRPRPATTTCRFRWASRGAAIRSRPTSPSSKAATSSARSASCRTRAATSGCGRSRTSSPRRGRRSATGAREIQLLGQIVNHYQAPDDPACDFAALLERLNEIDGLERIRFASPHPRHVTPRMIEAMRDAAEGLPAPAPAGAVRLDAGAGGDAPALHARGLPRARRPASARPCRTSRSRPI